MIFLHALNALHIYFLEIITKIASVLYILRYVKFNTPVKCTDTFSYLQSVIILIKTFIYQLAAVK